MILPVKAFWSIVLFMAPVVGLIFYLRFGLKIKARAPLNMIILI